MSSATPSAGLSTTPSLQSLPRFSRESTLTESAFSSIGTSLVESGKPSCGNASSKLVPSSRSQTSDHEFYLEGVKQLSTRLPHLTNCLAISRSSHHKYTIYNFENSILLNKTLYETPQNRPLGFEDCSVTFRKLIREDAPASLSRRFIIVEDLSTDLIETLGSELRVTPEFFEEHLVNSGWRDGMYEDQEASSWNTRGMKKPYTSVRWPRPAVLAIPRRISTQDKCELLKTRGRLLWDETVLHPNSTDGIMRTDVRHEISALVNIMRPTWSLNIRDKHEKTSEITVLEEKVSVWRKTEAGVQTILILLDPPPLVNEKLAGTEAALLALGVCGPQSSVERPCSLSLSHTSSSLDDLEPSLELTTRGSPTGNQVQVEEDATREGTSEKAFFSNTISQRIKCMFAGRKRDRSHDNIEAGVIAGATIHGNGQRDRVVAPPVPKADAPSKAQRTSPSRYMGSLLASFTTSRPDSGISPAVGKTRSECVRSTPLFRDLVPRGPIVNDYEALFTPSERGCLECQNSSTVSTADTLSQWIDSTVKPETRSSLPDPLRLLFDIMKRDSGEVLNLCETTLTTIGRDMLDDSTLQENLRHWRATIEKIESELSRLRDSLNIFVSSFTVQNPAPSSGNPPLLQDPTFPNLLTRISKLEKQTSKTHKHLMATVSIIESKRGIAESENITKLTELSFLFIPLTFSASVFSMQVRELRDAHVSIFTFAILGFTLVVAMYSIRLLTRSQSFNDWRKKCTGQVRASSRIQAGAFIPTRSYLIWIWRNVGLMLALASFVALVTVPGLVVLWRKVENAQLNGFITLLAAFDALMASRYLAKALFYSDSSGLHFRYSIFPLKEIKTAPEGRSQEAYTPRWQRIKGAWARKSVQFLLFMNLACLPLSFMWAQPTSVILKMAVTGVMMMFISFHVFVYTSKQRTLEMEKWSLPR